MKVFTFKAKGVWLPASIVIVCARKHKAKELARRAMRQANLDPSTLELVEEQELDTPIVAYFYNGDY
jgi:hypothetical protein